MIDFITVLLCVLIVLFTYFFLIHKSLSPDERNLPPGPKGLPLLGYAPFLRPPMFQAFTKLRETYGEIVTVQLGMLRIILLNSYRTFKLTMIDDSDNFSARLQSKYIDHVSHGCGIVFVDGPKWVEHRRFTLKVLRDFGLGKSLSEEIIQREAEAMMDHINPQLGRPINTLQMFYRSVANVICTIAFGDRPGYEDAEFSVIIDKLHYIAHDTGFMSLLLIIFPPMIKLVPLIEAIFGKQKPVAYTEAGHDFIRGKINGVRSRMIAGENPTNLTEAYLIEQAKQNQKFPNGDHTYTDFQLMRLIFELFIAGTDTSSTALAWGLLLMSLNAQIQTKVHCEIDEVIGRARLTNLRDKKQMPYTSAVLDEISRFSSLAPTGIPHRVFTKATVDGFTIPADTVVLPNIHAVHTDPDVWEHPDQFYPEHFLTKNGEEYATRDELVPFGIGKRSCLGESLARSEFFIFFVTLMQKYRVELHNAQSVNKDELLVGTDGTVRAPGAHDIIFNKR